MLGMAPFTSFRVTTRRTLDAIGEFDNLLNSKQATAEGS